MLKNSRIADKQISGAIAQAIASSIEAEKNESKAREELISLGKKDKGGDLLGVDFSKARSELDKADRSQSESVDHLEKAGIDLKKLEIATVEGVLSIGQKVIDLREEIIKSRNEGGSTKLEEEKDHLRKRIKAFEEEKQGLKDVLSEPEGSKGNFRSATISKRSIQQAAESKG